MELSVDSRSVDFMIEMIDATNPSTKNDSANQLCTTVNLLKYALEKVVSGTFKTYTASDIAATTTKLLLVESSKNGQVSAGNIKKLKKANKELFATIADHVKNNNGLYGSNMLNQQVFETIGAILFNNLDDKERSVLSWIYNANDLNNLKKVLPYNIQKIFNRSISTSKSISVGNSNNGSGKSSSTVETIAAKKAALIIDGELSTQDTSIISPFHITTVDIVPEGNIAKTISYQFNYMKATATKDSICKMMV